MSSLNRQQAARWLEVLRQNLAEQRRRPRLSADQRLQFLSEQYQQLYLLNRALQGTVIFVGAPPLGESLPEASSS